MAASVGNVLTFMSGGLTELNRRIGETGAEEAAKPQKEEAKKSRDEQLALQAKQKKELEDIEEGQRLVKEGQQKSAALRASTKAKGGREGTLLGVFGSSGSGSTPIKTLLGS